MKKIIIALFLVFLVLALGAGTVVSAGTFDGLPEDIAKTLQLANQEIQQKYGHAEYYAPQNINGLPVNADLLRSRALIVYGSPHDLDPATSHHRYLGQTMAGEEYTNTLFRHDPNPTPGLINDWDWIPNPWRSNEVEKSLKDRREPRLKENQFNGNPELNDSIIRGLESYQQGEGAAINFVRDNTPWHTYVHVLQPPTDYTWGMGRMWHQRPDGIRYLTVPMAPLKAGPPPELDLAVTALDSGVPAGEKARPGQQYTGTMVVENLSGVAASKPAAVKATHNGHVAVITDHDGNIVQALQLPPGEKMTLYFKWHGSAKSISELKATINLPPDEDLAEITYDNNEKTVMVPIDLQNLWVEVDKSKQEALEGNSVNVAATIHNDSGQLLVTRLVWKLDGKVIKDIPNFDIIKQETDSVTVTPGAGSHTLTVEVNPDRDKPAGEVTYDDNKKTVSINILPAIEEASGSIQIIGPSTWESLTLYPFTVRISGSLPYERYRDKDGNIRYRSRSYTMNVRTRGEGVLTTSWSMEDMSGNPQVTVPVVKSWSDSYTKSSGSFTQSFNYVFPKVGMRGMSKSTLVIEATDSRFGTARKVVTINPAPVKSPDLQLTQ